MKDIDMILSDIETYTDGYCNSNNYKKMLEFENIIKSYKKMCITFNKNILTNNINKDFAIPVKDFMLKQDENIYNFDSNLLYIIDKHENGIYYIKDAVINKIIAISDDAFEELFHKSINCERIIKLIMNNYS